MPKKKTRAASFIRPKGVSAAEWRLATIASTPRPRNAFAREWALALDFAAGQRSPTKASKRAPEKPPTSFFARATPRVVEAPAEPAFEMPPIIETEWERLARSRTANVLAALEREGLEPDVRSELRKIEWEKPYFVRLVVDGYEDKTPKAAPRGYGSSSRRTIIFVGQGGKTLLRVLYLAGEVETILSCEVQELSRGVKGYRHGVDEQLRPLFEGAEVELLDGTTRSGEGKHVPKKKWRTKRKTGRLSREEYSRRRHLTREQNKRARKSAAKVEALYRVDPIAAEKLRGRIKRQRAAWLRKNTKPKRRK